MRLARRLVLATLLVFSVALLGAGSALAETTPVITIHKMLQTSQPGYYEPGDSITYRYEVGGNERFINVDVQDDKCSPVTPINAGDGFNVGDTLAPKGALNGLAGEVWVYTCTTTAPAWVDPGASFTNKGTVTATSPEPPGWEQYQGITWTDDDTFTLTAVALRKSVFTFWNYIVGIADPGAGNVAFSVDVKNGGNVVGTETVSANAPLYLWMAPGTWQLKEQTPPAGYRVFDGRDTWNVNLADSWRDNSFINGSDFDLAVTKTGPDFAFAGASVTYGYTVTNAGPAAVKPVVTDDMCSPVTYSSGDANTDGLIQSTETWTFACTTTPSWIFPGPLTNTATVAATHDLKPAYPGGPIFGGDVNHVNDTDTYSLYPFVLRKDVGLYNDGAYPNFGAFSDNTSFSVKASLGGVQKGTFQISEQSPKQMWLGEGTWKFEELNVPQGYFPFYANIMFTTGAYPDWTYLNVTWSGCSHGYWKNHTPWPGGYTPSTLIKGPFTNWAGAASATFGDALAFPGGSGTTGAQQILLRQAVAALLNEARYGSAFGPYTSTGDLIAAVNGALGGSRGTMLTLAETLDHWNNGVCRH